MFVDRDHHGDVVPDPRVQCSDWWNRHTAPVSTTVQTGSVLLWDTEKNPGEYHFLLVRNLETSQYLQRHVSF